MSAYYNFTLRNLSQCHRAYIQELAAQESRRRGYRVSQSKIIAEIIKEKMNKENFSC
jgi:hypothetical protein